MANTSRRRKIQAAETHWNLRIWNPRRCDRLKPEADRSAFDQEKVSFRGTLGASLGPTQGANGLTRANHLFWAGEERARGSDGDPGTLQTESLAGEAYMVAPRGGMDVAVAAQE